MAKTVLIVDDNESIRQALCEFFRCQADFEVCGDAEDGREAIEMAEQLRPTVCGKPAAAIASFLAGGQLGRDPSIGDRPNLLNIWLLNRCCDCCRSSTFSFPTLPLVCVGFVQPPSVPASANYAATAIGGSPHARPASLGFSFWIVSPSQALDLTMKPLCATSPGGETGRRTGLKKLSRRIARFCRFLQVIAEARPCTPSHAGR
jgi:CheY-like chemotaxis protein